MSPGVLFPAAVFQWKFLFKPNIVSSGANRSYLEDNVDPRFFSPFGGCFIYKSIRNIKTCILASKDGCSGACVCVCVFIVHPVQHNQNFFQHSIQLISCCIRGLAELLYKVLILKSNWSSRKNKCISWKEKQSKANLIMKTVAGDIQNQGQDFEHPRDLQTKLK